MHTDTTGKGDNRFSQTIVTHFMLSFKQLCLVTVSLPLFALLMCFITAYIFQYDDIHETHCRVYNIIPSISAITGVSPQRYLWRVSVAFHIGPRLLIAFVYHAYQKNLINNKASLQLQAIANKWIDIAFWLNVLEIISLCGVTYISNIDNYPVHEKIFITFMVSSLAHMLACIEAMKRIYATGVDVPGFEQGILIKRILFILSLCSTIGLIFFFLKHRLLCHDMAFSWFALCEYIVASANMAFHITVIFDFPTEKLMVAKSLPLVQQHSSTSCKLD